MREKNTVVALWTIVGLMLLSPVFAFFILLYVSTPPDVKIGVSFYEVSERLGSPDKIWLNCDEQMVTLRYSYGPSLFTELMSIEINSSGTVVNVHQDQAW